MEGGGGYVSEPLPCVSEHVRLAFLPYQLGPG